MSTARGTAFREKLREDSAFVVHVASAPGPGCHGRVEHVSSGLATHFESAAELIAFMHETLGRGPGDAVHVAAAPAGSAPRAKPMGGSR
jgi:hypothetical protein